MITVLTAEISRSLAATSGPSPSSSATSLIPIQTSSAAPTSCTYGKSSNCTAKKVRMIRNTTAPTTPQKIPSLRCAFGRLRQASAMTTALSPDNRMLMTMISSAATQNCGEANSTAILVEEPG